MPELTSEHSLTDDELAGVLAGAFLVDPRSVGLSPGVPGGNWHDISMRLGQRLDGTRMQEFLRNNPEIKSRSLDLCWSWVRAGLIRPYEGNADTFAATAGSRELIEHVAQGAEVVHVPGRFAASLEERAPGIDPIALGYASYAQDSFLAGHYVACVVLLGVSSETLIIELGNAIEGARRDLGLTGPAISGNAAKRQDAVAQVFTTDAGTLRSAIGDRVQVLEVPRLLGIPNAIRLGRNRAGHPKELANRRDQAHELMGVFPEFAAATVAATHALHEIVT